MELQHSSETSGNPSHSKNGAQTKSAPRPQSKPAADLYDFFNRCLEDFPFQIHIHDWTGADYSLGRGQAHWYGEPLNITIKTSEAAQVLLSGNSLGFLEKFLEGDVDLSGNLYCLSEITPHVQAKLTPMQIFFALIQHSLFQSKSRAKVNVKSHYDIPQEALNLYLDQKYMSYSCGMFEDPSHYDRQELIRVGVGENDQFDSLEKSMWRKFKDAIDYIDPADGETVLDVGCGYSGQLAVALENFPKAKIVGWTHSSNQAREGRKMLAPFSSNTWEIHEGDYREETRVFDHITSTGMISHVGPRGLVPYVKEVRKRIKLGGRYVHHALMRPHCDLPHDFYVSYVFHKKYVWPGFHWFTVGTHVTALENNGFEVQRLVNLSAHYGKTTAAWYERMMAHKAEMIEALGEPTFRAWQIFLAGISGSFLNHGTHVYRLYCEAVPTSDYGFIRRRS
ncbi:MAG: class I SAM-dependent methyltransferase [Bdellovibrionales bacterium]|nr:class I SAM-dependent methyltransferase [Bdellovibrionales bacterium]